LLQGIRAAGGEEQAVPTSGGVAGDGGTESGGSAGDEEGFGHGIFRGDRYGEYIAAPPAQRRIAVPNRIDTALACRLVAKRLYNSVRHPTLPAYEISA
jgi:hypothetical protein